MATINSWNSNIPVEITKGGTGAVTLTDGGLLVGSGTGAITALGVATNGQLVIGSSAADPVVASMTGTQGIELTAGAGSLDVKIDDNTHTTAIHGWDGSLIETDVITVTSDGATITFSVEKSGGGNLTVVFSDGFFDWTTAPDTIALTAGSDTSPQINYVYFLQSTKLLTVSTVSFPAAEHAPLATVLCQSAASLAGDGAYKVHAWTDHVEDATNNGHIGHINHWIRTQNATWESGVAPTLTITPNGGSADNVIFTSASGVVEQLHEHTFPAFSGTPDVYVVNDSVTPYDKVTDLNTQLTDSTGASMSGKFFSLVIWGVISETSSDCKLYCNLPGGSYNTVAGITSDSSKFANYTIPSDFKGAGFLIAELQLRHQAAASGTWTEIDLIDLRGLLPAISAGGSTSAQTEFEDNTFRIIDEGDNTKEIAFEASGITTATTRTMTVQNADGTIAYTAVTGSGTGLTTITDHGVMVGSGTSPITPLSVGGTGELLVGAAGADPAFSTSANGDFAFTTTSSGTTRKLEVSNSDATGAADSSAELNLTTMSGSAGDPYIRFDVNGGQDYSLGIDNSDIDSLKITDNSDPSTGNTLWRMSTDGERTMPLQPSFSATLSQTYDNVTGDGTTYTVIFATVLYDQGNDFDGTSTFTTPEAGKYFFEIGMRFDGLNAAHDDLRVQLVAGGTTYILWWVNPGTILVTDTVTNTVTRCLTLAAATAVTVTIQVGGDTKTADLITAGNGTFFSAHLMH